MVRSLWSGVSGLNAHQTKMDVIGNNIANVNTYGFKASRTSFSDIFYQAKKSATGGTTTFAGNNESAVGYGVEVSSIDKDMSASSFQNTNRVLDVSISGDGFFITGTIDDMKNIDDVNYTRYGGFGVDSAGNLVNTLNRFVLGTENDGTYTSKEMDDKVPAASPRDLDTINVNDRVWDAFRRYTQIDYTDVPKKYKGTQVTKGGFDVYEYEDNGATTQVLKFGSKYYEMPADATATIVSGANGVPSVQDPANPDNLTALGEATIPTGVTPEPSLTGKTIYSYEDPYDTSNQIAYDRDINDVANGFKQVGTDANGDPVLEYVPGVKRTNEQLDQEIQAALAVQRGGGTLSAEQQTLLSGTPFLVVADYASYYVGGKFVNSQGVEYDPERGAYKDKDGNFYSYNVTTSVDENGNVTKTHRYTLLEKDPNTGDLPKDGNNQFIRNPATDPARTYEYEPTDKSFWARDDLGNMIYANMELRPLTYGDLSGFSVGADGSLVADYGGVNKTLARIAVATFDNPEGLDQVGETAFAESTNSGVPRVKVAGKLGAGATKSSRLEMSNVNLANEFSDMIVTQRGFQANARIITTSDSMLEELVNMKR